MKDTLIGFVGFGEAAYHIAKGFNNQGVQGMKAFDVLLSSQNERKAVLEKRLKETGVSPVLSIEELVCFSKIVIIAVPAKFARDVSLEVLGYMSDSQLCVDITTNRPAVKKELGRLFEAEGKLYVDASVMGAVPLYQHMTPTLVCGNGAQKMMEIMAPLGMNLKYVGTEAGKAVKMKLTRSIFIKGVEALVLEMLLTARKLGIEKEIMEGLEESFQKQGFTKLTGQLATSNVQHSARRALEAGECMELEEELGLNSIMMEATKRKLEWAAQLGYGDLKPSPVCSSLDELYELWERCGICENS